MSTMMRAPRRVYLCLGVTDLRKSFDSLAAIVQEVLGRDPFEEAWFVFRNRSGDRIKVLWWDGSGYCVLYKRLEYGTFVFPPVREGQLAMTATELALLLEGMDWRGLSVPRRPRPQAAA